MNRIIMTKKKPGTRRAFSKEREKIKMFEGVFRGFYARNKSYERYQLAADVYILPGICVQSVFEE